MHTLAFYLSQINNSPFKVLHKICYRLNLFESNKNSAFMVFA